MRGHTLALNIRLLTAKSWSCFVYFLGFELDHQDNFLRVCPGKSFKDHFTTFGSRKLDFMSVL